MIDAHDAFDDAALPIAGLYLNKDKFKELFTLADASDRLQFQIVAGTGSNVVGELSLPGTEGPRARSPRPVCDCSPALRPVVVPSTTSRQSRPGRTQAHPSRWRI